jgi:tetratricopeptide (TPR) repeat protein
MSATVTLLPIRATLSGRWQLPSFVLGACLLVTGIRHDVRQHHAVAFEEEIARVQCLQAAGATERASAYLLNLLAKPDRSPIQRAAYHRLLAEAIYWVESEFTLHNASNVAAITAHFEKALRGGGRLSAENWASLGDAYRWANQDGPATDAYNEALKQRPPHADRVRRDLVEIQLARGAMNPDLLTHINAILADGAASPGNYVWALERKVQSLLERGNAASAMSLIEQAQARLAGTEERPAVRYLGALCLRDVGLCGEAEQSLHALRDEWRSRDELWGKAGWLLGRLQQEDQRPQAALSFYGDVLRSFQSGDLRSRALGRAECLAALGALKALEAFTGSRPADWKGSFAVARSHRGPHNGHDDRRVADPGRAAGTRNRLPQSRDGADRRRG